MASIQKRNKKYAVVYTYEDDEGRKKQKWESFGSYKEAKIRKSEVENNMDKSVFLLAHKILMIFWICLLIYTGLKNGRLKRMNPI